MKKFIAILALAMALCLACGAALAAVTYDYSTAILVTNGNGTLVVKFKSTAPTGNDEDGNPVYAFQEWKVYKLKATYATKLADLQAADVGITFKVVKAATCTEDAVLALIPQNAGLFTTNAAYVGEAKMLPDTEKPVAGYTFYIVSADDVQNINMAELKTANKALYEAYKATGHAAVLDYKVVKEATCTEPGELIPVCPLCKTEFDPIITNEGGHKSLLTEAQEKTLSTAKVGTTEKATDSNSNEYTYKVTAASTCAKGGTYTGYCYACGKKDAAFALPKNPNAHEFGEWQIEKAATCLNKGMEYRLCKLCLNAAVKEERVTAPLGHDWVFDVTKAATCTEKGTAKKITCSRCKITVTANAGAFVIKNTTDADKIDVETELNTKGYTANNNVIDLPVDPNNHPKEFWAKVDSGVTVQDAEGKATTAAAATCTKDGLEVYQCKACTKVANTVKLSKTGHSFITFYIYVDAETGERRVSDKPTCAVKADGKPVDQWKVVVCQNEILKKHSNKLDDLYKAVNGAIDAIIAEGAACGVAPQFSAVTAPDHTWDAWVERNAPSETTPGYWIRECKVCGLHDQYSGYTAPTNATDPTKPTKNGLQLEEDGTFQLYVDGQKSNANGIFAYDGQQFVVTGGKLDKVNGAQLVNGEWYWVAEGRVVAEANGFVEYDGQWFVAKAGKIDTSYNGLFSYNGGKFVIAAGRLVKEYSGLWQNSDGAWYFISNGQVFDWYNGVVEYDGATFTVVNGKVA